MSIVELFPKFDDPKLRKLVEILEHQLFSKEYHQRMQGTVTSGSYDVGGIDEVLHVDYSSTGVSQINLPTPRLFQGRSLVVYDRGGQSAANNITIKSGATTVYIISTNSECVTLASDGDNWYIEGKN